MLQALDYLASQGIMHRGVKPENILYQALPDGGYTFQLTEFGVCSAIADARTLVRFPTFIAPKFFSGAKQAYKVDIWSLYVTLAYALNVDGLWEKRFDTPWLSMIAVQGAADNRSFSCVQGMAIVDLEARASAADMLDKLFNGGRRSTPRGLLKSAPLADNTAVSPQKERKLAINKKFS